MNTYRENLPQLEGGYFLTDGGLETTLNFHQRLEFPELATVVARAAPAGSRATATTQEKTP